MKQKMRRKMGLLITLFTIIVIGTASWAMYNLINTAIEQLLAKAGISDIYLQGGIVLGIAILILMLLGTGLFKAIEKVIKA